MAFTPGLAFHALTPLYDMLNAALGFGRPFMRRVQAALALRGHEAVLDIGSGTGTLLAALAARHPAAHLAGLDADGRMLARARTKLDAAPRVLLLQAYAQALPFRSAAFDVVVSTLIFHHLPTAVKRTALAEVRRVLRPGGRLLLADFGKPQNATQRILLHVGSLFDGRENMRANLAGMMPALLAEAGFRVTEAAPAYRAVQFLLAVSDEGK